MRFFTSDEGEVFKKHAIPTIDDWREGCIHNPETIPPSITRVAQCLYEHLAIRSEGRIRLLPRQSGQRRYRVLLFVVHQGYLAYFWRRDPVPKGAVSVVIDAAEEERAIREFAEYAREQEQQEQALFRNRISRLVQRVFRRQVQWHPQGNQAREIAAGIEKLCLVAPT